MRESIGTRRPRRSSRTVTINLDPFNAAMARREATSNLEVAELLGCGEGTVSRIRSNGQRPGASFIGCVAVTVDRDEFHAIFNWGPRLAQHVAVAA